MVTHIQILAVTFPTGPGEVMCWQRLERDNGVGRTTLCLCPSSPPEIVAYTGYLATQHNGPLGPADHRQSYTWGRLLF